MFFSNAELMLMQLIFESPNKTGYEINNWVKKLGYNRWAGVGKTSVYNGLSKLILREYLTSHVNANKKGKGLETIRTARERDQRFDLTISAIHLLSETEIVNAFSIRKEFLNKEYDRLSADYKEQKDCLHDGGELLYERMLMSLENELRFAGQIFKRYSVE